ncbi:MAG: hypothetical protein ABFQ82_03730, partial [Thermodesulfobacteriota bacterium]
KLMLEGDEAEMGRAGQKVDIVLPADFPAANRGVIEVYKVDVRSRASGSGNEEILAHARKKVTSIKAEKKKQIQRIQQRIEGRNSAKQVQPSGKGKKRKSGSPSHGRKGKSSQLPLECWLKLDTVAPIFHKLPFKADRFLLTIDQKNVSGAGKLKKYLGKSVRDVIWSLPPILLEHELWRMRKLVNTLSRSGYRNFQIAHISQADLFDNKRVHLYGDYTLNLMNHQAVAWAETAGLEATQLSIELDRHCLKKLIGGYKTMGGNNRLGLTVYGTPPLFTARLAPKHFQYNRELKSPKQEMFVIKKKKGFTQTFSKRPFSLLPYLHELGILGLDYVVIDLSNMSSGKKEMQNVADMLSGKTRFLKLPTFNYLGKLE